MDGEDGVISFSLTGCGRCCESIRSRPVFLDAFVLRSVPIATCAIIPSGAA